MEHEGGCLCGAVRYSTRGPLREVIFCHCGQCRKQTGLYFAASGVALADLEIAEAGALRWYAASDSAKRGFCGTCGSVLFWRPDAETRIAILAGSFDDPSVLRPGYHIFTEGRAGFYEIADDLPHYAGFMPG
jgi:hypothetical protein